MGNFFEKIKKIFNKSKNDLSELAQTLPNEDKPDETDNYRQCRAIMADLSITELVKLYNVINCVARGDYSDLFEEMIIEAEMEAELNEELSEIDITSTDENGYETFGDVNNSSENMAVYSAATVVLDTLANELDEVLFPLRVLKERCATEVKCPVCGEFLYLSDLKQYDFVCPNCDENFFSCEIYK